MSKIFLIEKKSIHLNSWFLFYSWIPELHISVMSMYNMTFSMPYFVLYTLGETFIPRKDILARIHPVF
jgi:hypothetical protein